MGIESGGYSPERSPECGPRSPEVSGAENYGEILREQKTPIQHVIEYNTTGGQGYLQTIPHETCANERMEAVEYDDQLDRLKVRWQGQPDYAAGIRQLLAPEVRQHQEVLSELSGVPMSQ